MGLITKEVEVTLGVKNVKFYEDLGYEIPKKKNKWGKVTIPRGTKIKVKVEDLQEGSKAIVECVCDNCKQFLPPKYYRDYKRFVKEDGKTYCQKCATEILARDKMLKTRLKNSKTFEQWCIENNRYDILLSWDYDLNDCSPDEVTYMSSKKCWFKCLLHPEHMSKKFCISYITRNKTISCDLCKSIAQWLIDKYGDNALEIYWDYNRNTVDPWEISYGSAIKVWFICQDEDCGKSYEMTCCDFSNNHRCPCNKHLKGEKNPNWNHDLTLEERLKGRKIKGYNDFVRETLKRDNYTCQCCGHYATNLNAHHLDGYNWCKEKRTDINNGITLCETCHREFHKLYGKGNNTKEQFEEYLKIKKEGENR